MSDRPIIFSTPMVWAILDGRKTQTRRVLKPQPDPALPIAGAEFVALGDDPGRWCWLNGFDGSIVAPFIPPYTIGDRLWVRETWTLGADSERDDGFVVYRADGKPRCPHGRWRPSIHMPRWASRLTLTVTDVRIERVQDINEADAIAEGLAKRAKDRVPTWKYGIPDRDGMPGADDDGWQWQDWCVDPRSAFGKLWNSINEARGYGWEDNPWVVALTFTAEQRNIDAGTDNA